MSRTWLVAASGGAAALLFTATALSQTIPWPQGNRLTAVVSLDSVTAPGGSGVLSFRYKLENRPGSEQSARILIIETRVPVLHLVAPEPAQRWVHVGPQAADSVAFWGSASREQDVKPGFTRTGFTLVTTSGLPGIVHFWVQGRFDVPTVTEAQEDSVAEAPRVEDNSFAGLVASSRRGRGRHWPPLAMSAGRDLIAGAVSGIASAVVGMAGPPVLRPAPNATVTLNLGLPRSSSSSPHTEETVTPAKRTATRK